MRPKGRQQDVTKDRSTSEALVRQDQLEQQPEPEQHTPTKSLLHQQSSTRSSKLSNEVPPKKENQRQVLQISRQPVHRKSHKRILSSSREQAHSSKALVVTSGTKHEQRLQLPKERTVKEDHPQKRTVAQVSETFALSPSLRITFSQLPGGTWQAQRTNLALGLVEKMPVVCQGGDIAAALRTLRAQPTPLLPYRIHVLKTQQPPYAPRYVYIGKLGLMGGAYYV